MATNGLTILAVDDHQDNLIALKAVVEDAFPGARTLTALNGPKGIELALAEAPDVILLDIVMPGMDGFEVCRRLKADERVRHIPVVFLTAIQTSRENRIRALETGAEAFLSKPVEELELTAQIRAMAKIKAAHVSDRQEKARLASLVWERTRELEEELAVRKRAEEALRASEEKFRGMAEQLVDVLFVTDTKGVITYVSPSVDQMFGWSPEEMTGREFTTFLPEEERPRAIASLRAAVVSGQPVHALVLVMKRKDGSTFAGEVNASIIRKDGGIEGTTGLIRDVTERKRSEETLRTVAESEAAPGEDVFRFLVRQLAVSQGKRHALLARVDERDLTSARTIAVWSNGRFVPNFSYALDGTPCQNVAAQGVGFYPRHVQTLFPEDRLLADLGAESYWGVPVHDAAGNLLGVVAILDDRPLERRPQTLSLLKSFAARAGAELARQSMEEKYQMLFNQMLDGFAVHEILCDPAGKPVDYRFVAANPAFERMTGLRATDIVGKTVLELMPDLEAHWIETYGRVALTGEPVRFENHAGPLDKWFEINAFCPREKQFACAVRDITERKRSEEALRESEETLQALCANALDAIIMMDSEGRAILWNPAAERIFGYSAAEMIGRPVHDFVAPASQREHFQEHLPAFQVTGQGELIGKVVEVTGLRKDGSEFPMEIALSAVKRGQLWQSVGIVRDVTARNVARKQIEEANHRYDLVAEHTRTVVWEVNTEGLYTYVNPVSEVVWGYLPEELTGKKHFFDMHPDEDREELKADAFEVIARKEHVRDLENRIQTKDGRTIWVSTNCLPIIDDGGELLGYWGAETEITERKRAEEALRESELRYRSLFEHMLDGFAYCKMLYDDRGQPVDFVYLEVNDAFEHLTGRRNVVGRRVTEVIPGIRKSHPELFEIYGRVARTGKPETFEINFDPISRWLNVSVYSAAKGHFVAVFDDITERKLNEADREAMLAVLRLANSSNNSRELIRTVTLEMQAWSGCAAVGIRLQDGEDFPYYETRGFPAEFVQAENYLCAWDANGEMLRNREGNPVLECMCGNILCGRFDPRRPFFTTGGSFWTNSTSKLLASTTEGDLQARTRNRCNGEGFESVALIPLRASGRTLGLLQFNDRRPDRFTPERIAVMERAAASLAIALEQRRTQQELRASEERYRLISENTADVIWLLDLATGRFTYVSPSVQNLLGYSPEEATGKRMSDILTPESCRYAIRRIAEVRTNVDTGGKPGVAQVHQLDHVRKDGSIVRAEVLARALPSSNGGVSEIVGVTRDITERIEAEARLMQAQKMESVGRLAGGVAHDFNNLLTVINGYSQMLLRDLKAGDPARDGLQEIHEAGERAAKLTQQILAFSRKQVLQPRVLDIDRVVDEIRPMLSRMVGEDIELRVQLRAETAKISADPDQLGQVIMNLAVNSRDAMPHGGKLSIETDVMEGNDGSLQLQPGTHAGAWVMLAVSDTGVGMDEETKKHIFEPFFTTKGVGEGTGLGLSTVQGIVEQSGGHIEVHSEKGKGTTFKIYLPSLAEGTADTTRPTALPAQGGKETVLVVEDQEEVRKYATAVLKTYGYRVLGAAHAEEAWLHCKREQIDLLLTDVVMPKVSGRELADRLAKLQPDIKVLFMSGYTDKVIVNHGGLEAGVKFIQKPFSPEELAGKVRTVLGSPARVGRILVADDEAGVRHFLRAVLEDGGYEVSEAADGKQALQQARAGHLDLVITDLVMPEQEGIETIQALRREMPGVGIIAISGAFGGQFLKTAQLLGADAVLSKPVSTELLLATVAEVLKLRS